MIAGCLLLGTGGSSAQAQVAECRSTPYHHVGCDDGSGPDYGKWAWNPGEPSNWPGLGVVGNMHWWVQFGWYDALRYEAVRARDGDLPSLAFAFYDTEALCGCDVSVIKARVRHHLRSPSPNHVVFHVRSGQCAFDNASVLVATFTSTSHVSRDADYDVSVDAQARYDRETGGEANLIWEADGTNAPRGGCPGNPRARVHLGGLRHCIDLRLKSTDPQGICCSTSHLNPYCLWTQCGL